MAKVKNTGTQPRGFITDDGSQVVVLPGEEAEFNLTEADFKKAKEVAESEDPPPYEISGSHGGVKKLNPKEQAAADAKKAEENAKRLQAEAKEAAKEYEKEAEKETANKKK